MAESKAISALKEKFANGEITENEYRDRLRILTEEDKAPAISQKSSYPWYGYVGFAILGLVILAGIQMKNEDPTWKYNEIGYITMGIGLLLIIGGFIAKNK